MVVSAKSKPSSGLVRLEKVKSYINDEVIPDVKLKSVFRERKRCSQIVRDTIKCVEDARSIAEPAGVVAYGGCLDLMRQMLGKIENGG